VSSPENEKKLKIPEFALHATRGLIRDQGIRRKLMLATILVAFGFLVAGSTFLQSVLNPREHPVWFILFWFVCAWLTGLAILLALFDVLMTRAQGRAARKALAQQFPTAPTPDSPSKRPGG
jgi:hypothetical protein